MALMRRVVGPEMGVKAAGGVQGLHRAECDGRGGSDAHRCQRGRADRSGIERNQGPASAARRLLNKNSHSLLILLLSNPYKIERLAPEGPRDADRTGSGGCRGTRYQ